MKKFIISFDYQGFLFSARVLVKRDNGPMIISTILINNPIEWLLEDGQLIFMQRGGGFQLVLFKKDRSFEILEWKIKLEYLDKEQIVEAEVFSLS